ncbi:hypothetical protein PG991_013242, partial [Apiospora marii]
ANGEPYEVLAPDTRYVFVTSQKHIKELDSAPDTVLSLQAASKQMLQPMYTMHGFNWFDRRGTEGVGFVRALRTLLTSNLPNILPDLSAVIKLQMASSISSHSIVGGVRHSPVYPMITKLVVLANAYSFFGEELAKNEPFMLAARSYIEETLLCAELVKVLPKFMGPIIGRLVASRMKSHEVIYDSLIPIAEQRCRERDQKLLGQPVPNHADCIQWIMETSPRQNPWTPKRIVHELMAIWFGSVHALSTTITFAIQDLCLHPEYVEPLRRSCREGFDEFTRTGKGLELLDSFIKESARLTPVESMSTRRCATQPFTLSNGTTLGIGDWACTPVRSIMQYEQYYPESLHFHGFRFAPPKLVEEIQGNFKVPQPSTSKLTDAGDSWHVWGTGRMVCPGRYYASAVMKLLVGLVVMNYDCELVDARESRWFTWRSCILPREDTMMVFHALGSTNYP